MTSAEVCHIDRKLPLSRGVTHWRSDLRYPGARRGQPQNVQSLDGNDTSLLLCAHPATGFLDRPLSWKVLDPTKRARHVPLPPLRPSVLEAEPTNHSPKS